MDVNQEGDTPKIVRKMTFRGAKPEIQLIQELENENDGMIGLRFTHWYPWVLT